MLRVRDYGRGQELLFVRPIQQASRAAGLSNRLKGLKRFSGESYPPGFWAPRSLPCHDGTEHPEARDEGGQVAYEVFERLGHVRLEALLWDRRPQLAQRGHWAQRGREHRRRLAGRYRDADRRERDGCTFFALTLPRGGGPGGRRGED